MSRRTRELLVTSIVIAAAVASVWRTAAAHPSPPNIILVFIDDMGWSDLSCFGNEAVETTNIDRLAAEGLRFEQFYVNSPICSPSRTAISTGQYPQRWRINSYLADRALNEKRGVAQWLDPKAPMLSRALQQSGYATGHFGKWHMGGQRDVGDAPAIARYGFDASLTNFEGLGPRVLPLLDAFDGSPAKKHALGSHNLGRGPIRWEQRDRVTAAYVAAAIEFLEAAQANSKPIYINLWPDDVHSPFYPPQARRGDGSKRQLYLGVLKTMDEQLGALFDRVRRDASLRDNTLILLCSDNGPEEGAGSAGPLRGNKATLYEGGIRSPLIVWGPGLIAESQSGTVNAESCVAAFDLVPSLMEIAGARIAANVRFDGEPLPEVLVGRSRASRREPLFFRRPPDRPGNAATGDLPDLAVRDGRWKLLCEYDGSRPQLYDLESDRGESKNVAADHPAVVARLAAAVLEWHHAMPPDNGPAFSATRDGGRKKPKRK